MHLNLQLCKIGRFVASISAFGYFVSSVLMAFTMLGCLIMNAMGNEIVDPYYGYEFCFIEYLAAMFVSVLTAYLTLDISKVLWYSINIMPLERGQYCFFDELDQGDNLKPIIGMYP